MDDKNDDSDGLARIKQYQSALRRRAEMEPIAKKLFETIQRAAKGLEMWNIKNCWVAGDEIPASDVNKELTFVFNPDEWPTQHDIREAIHSYRAAITEAEETWSKIDENDRIGLTGPGRL